MLRSPGAIVTIVLFPLAIFFFTRWLLRQSAAQRKRFENYLAATSAVSSHSSNVEKAMEKALLKKEKVPVRVRTKIKAIIAYMQIVVNISFNCEIRFPKTNNKQ